MDNISVVAVYKSYCINIGIEYEELQLFLWDFKMLHKILKDNLYPFFFILVQTITKKPCQLYNLSVASTILWDSVKDGSEY